MNSASCVSLTLFLSLPIFAYIYNFSVQQDRKVREEHDELQTKIAHLETSINKLN